MTPWERADKLLGLEVARQFQQFRSGIVEQIAAAIAEERESCAVLADEHARQYERSVTAIRDSDDGTPSPEADKAWIECEAYECYAAEAKEIAAAIRVRSSEPKATVP